MTSKPILGYWDIKDLAEPIRFLLHFKRINFEDKRYMTYDTWQNDKYNLDLDFPNLPYYIDGDIKLTQSITILRYLARKYGLDGATQEEKIRIELAEQQIVDFRTNLIGTSYNPEFEAVTVELMRNIPDQLQLFSAFLGDRKYLAGDNITYVDFMAYETFDFHQHLLSTSLKEFQNLQSFQSRLDSLNKLLENVREVYDILSKLPITPCQCPQSIP